MNDKPFYVYLLRRPSGEPFYVGMGRGNRMYKHERIARRGDDSYKSRIIRDILATGAVVGKEIVERFATAAEAIGKEIELIRSLGRADLGNGPLANHTDGGEGVIGWSEEMRRAQSKRGALTMANPAHKQKLLGIHLGRKQTPEEIEKRAAALRGRKRDPASVAKSAAGCRGQKRDPDLVAKHAAWLRGRKMPASALEKMAAHMRQRYSNPAERIAQSVRMKVVLADPVIRAKLKARPQVGRKHSDETRAKIAAGNRGKQFSAETIERMRQSAQRRESAKRLARNHILSWD